MAIFKTDEIRNIAVIGHISSGKTTLVESLLLCTNKIPKKGEVEKATTKSDYLQEEQQRQASMQLSLIATDYKNIKLNFLDVPGNEEKLAEFNSALNVVKGAILVVDATKGIEIGTMHAWNAIRKAHIPAVVFLNKMDKENISYEPLLEIIRINLGKKAIPFTYPIGRKEDIEGFVNVVSMKARIYNGTECIDAPIYEEKIPKIKELHDMIVESVAESDEKLLDKYLNGEQLSDAEIKKGLRNGIINGELTPVIVGSATKNIGVHTLLDMLIDYLPSPSDLKELDAIDSDNKQIKVKTDANLPFSGYVFKTLVDPYSGSLSLIKINSGKLVLNQEIYFENESKTFKVNQLFSLRGKEQVVLTEAYAGDIVAIAKLDGVKTGNTLTDSKTVVKYNLLDLPKPTYYIAIEPKNKNDDDKLISSLNKIQLEDASLEIKRVKETNQLLLGGYGDIHLNYVIERLKNMFKVEVGKKDLKVLYKETIKKTATGEGKHKKQSGGAGQFGHVIIEFSPTDKAFEFKEKVFGGSVPKGYFPAVEKGLVEVLEKGPQAGFPVVGVCTTLLDGSYHQVDSNEISFKLAAHLAFKDAISKLQMTILEPILKIKVVVSSKYVGDVMGDLNKRRGRILGIDQNENEQIITALVPEQEVIEYAIDLKSITQASGTFTREFAKYKEVIPQNLIPKIIEKYKSN